MQQDVINRIMKTENREQVMRVLSDRRNEILEGIDNGSLEPTHDLMGELYDLNLMLGDVPTPKDGDQ